MVNLSQPVYLSLLGTAAAMVGNSSSGLLEAPSFGLPVVNIGTRQQGRERAENVIDVGYSRQEILDGLKRALGDREFRERARACPNPYGDGNSGPRIARLLSDPLPPSRGLYGGDRHSDGAGGAATELADPDTIAHAIDCALDHLAQEWNVDL